MPRIPDFMQECVAYLYPDERSARAGERLGGSALLMAHHIVDDPTFHQLYIVTNAHLIEQGNLALRLNTKTGASSIIDTDERQWRVHPEGDDLAILPVRLDLAFYKYQLVTPNMFATREMVQKFGIGTGDDCFVVGRFINHEGIQKNQPSLRFGNISQMPFDPIMRDRADGSQIPQESYLLEVHSTSGYSGSPVFVHLTPGVPRPSPAPPLPTPGEWRGPWVLGISWCYLNGPDGPVFLSQYGKRSPTHYVAQANSGMMGVVPAWKLEELLNHPDLISLREARYDLERRQRGLV